MSKSALAVIIAIISAVFMAGFLIINFSDKDYEDDNIYCTQDAKLCPDGSYVGRTGPNCEFALCPSEDDGDEFRATGTIIGRVSIGPLCPVEPCQAQFQNPYLSRQLVFTPQGDVIDFANEDNRKPDKPQA